MSEAKSKCDHSPRVVCEFCGDNTVKPVSAPAEPAEYACPRCGSNVSTHICMGEPVAGETKRCQVCNDTGLECISRKTEAGDYDETFKPCTVCGRKPAYAMTPPAPSVAGETKYAPLDTKACFNTAAHFEHSWDYRNKTFRCLGKSIAPSVAGETKQCTIPPDGWTCSRKKGHEGPCAARPLTTTECDEGLSKEIGEELGFEVKRWDGDVLIRDSDSTEWTSAVAWARSAPQTVAVMLSDAFTSFVQCRARIVRGATPLPAPSVAVPEGEAKPDNDKWRVGRKLGRTLYVGDRFIGSVDTPELASQIVEAVNAGGVSKTFQSAEDFVAANFDGADGSYYAKGDRAMRLLFDVEVAQAYGNYVMEFMRGVSTSWLPAPGDWLLDHPNYDKWPRRNDSQISTLDDIQFNWITVVKLMSEYAAHVLAEKGK